MLTLLPGEFRGRFNILNWLAYHRGLLRSNKVCQGYEFFRSHDIHHVHDWQLQHYCLCLPPNLGLCAGQWSPISQVLFIRKRILRSMSLPI